MAGRDQYGYIKGPHYMVKPGPMPPGEHNKVESKKLHKLGFPNCAPHSALQAPQEKPSLCGLKWASTQNKCVHDSV